MNQKRIQFIFFCFLLVFIILIGRLINLSLFISPERIIQHKTEEKNSLLRGNIYSSNKDVLAVTLPFYSVYINPTEIDRTRIQNYITLLSQLGLSEKQIQEILNSKKKFRWLYRMIPKDTFLSLQKTVNFSLPSVSVTQEYKRVYPHHELAAPIVGFTDIDGKGLSGIEYSLENYLTPSIFSKSQGHLLGYDIVLTINSRLQYLVEQIIKNTANELQPKSISAIIMEADTGKLLSMASYPTFDPNIYNTYKAPNVFINTAISNIDEPGSTFKPLVMTYLFDKNYITANSRFSSVGGKEVINGFTIKEAAGKTFGTLSPEDILIHSSNIGMVKASQNLSKEALYLLLKNLHFGQKTGILLPGEEKGIIRSNLDMTNRSKIAIPIGQEIGLTPLQLVEAFSAIANNGILAPIRIIDRMEYEGKEIPAVTTENFINKVPVYSKKNTDLMLKYMRQVVLRGSAKKTNIPGEWIAAKTGTAQIFDNTKQSYSDLNTSLIAIYENAQTHKRYIIYGVIRSPQVDENITWGGTLAGPMVKEFIKALIQTLND